MYMKRQALCFAVAALAMAVTTTAQRPENFEQMRKERMEKRAKEQAKDLKLDKETSVWFTNLFIEYQEQLDAVRKEAMKDMPKPSKPEKDGEEANPEDMKEKEMKKLTDEQAEKFILGGFDVAEKEVAVKRDYYNRFREKLSPKQLLRIFSPRRGGMRGGQGGGQRGGRPMGGPGGFPPMGGPGGFPPMGGGF